MPGIPPEGKIEHFQLDISSQAGVSLAKPPADIGKTEPADENGAIAFLLQSRLMTVSKLKAPSQFFMSMNR